MTNIEKWEVEFDARFADATDAIYHYETGGLTPQIKDFIKTLLQQEQTRIAEEVENLPYIRDVNIARYRDKILSIIKQDENKHDKH